MRPSSRANYHTGLKLRNETKYDTQKDNHEDKSAVVKYLDGDICLGKLDSAISGLPHDVLHHLFLQVVEARPPSLTPPYTFKNTFLILYKEASLTPPRDGRHRSLYTNSCNAVPLIRGSESTEGS